jgi:hypothetical protein
MSNMVPRVSTLDLLIAVSNTTLNNKGAIASHYLQPLLTLHSEDKCLPILTLTYISLFLILHELIYFFWGGRNQLMHFTPYSSLHAVLCAT